MQKYDDFALCPEKFDDMAREYLKNQSRINSLSTKFVGQNYAKCCEINMADVDELLKKIEYLRVLIDDLKERTGNHETLIVLNDIQSDLSEEMKNLAELFHSRVVSYNQENEPMRMFCNNLKLAINTTSDIIRLLIKIKDDDQSFELSPSLTQSINIFLEINNQLVSLFGECRYLRY